jgi:hypothetical protein
MSDIVPGNQIEVASHPFVDALLNDCVEGFYMVIPTNVLPRVDFLTNAVQLVPSDEVLVYRIQLPEKFIRLIAFRCTEWKKSVSQAITEGSPQHNAQFGKHTFGGNTRPNVTIVSDPDLGRSIEYYLYNTTTTVTTLIEASCAVKSAVEEIPDILIDVFSWYVAAKAFKAMGEVENHDSAMKEVEQFIQTHN